MDSVGLIRYTLRDSMENCGNHRTCLLMEKYLKYDKNSKCVLYVKLRSYFFVLYFFVFL